MLSEQELIQSAQAGNAVAFEQLIADHQKSIFSIAYRIAGNQEDAADMTQEVLVKVFRNLKNFRGDSKFSTWLYRVATTTCLDEQKKQRRHTAYSLDEELETEDGSLATDLRDTGPTPEESAERKAIQQAIHLAIGKLKEEHKKVILLREVRGLSYEEIAKILKCSEGTVKSRINRARENLKKILLQNRELFD
ncbi:MAG: sigma-70 family RNA polymerase sigma factor [Clostridia bacterium]|nr:sigma-70 family RNA polymerase sigma factor [Clostridia bacterium]